MRTESRVLFNYVRSPLNHSQLIATVCVIEYTDGDVQWSFSQCNPVDQFSKKIGRAIAYRRAQNGFIPKEVAFKVYNPDGTKKRTLPVSNSALQFLLQQARELRV